MVDGHGIEWRTVAAIDGPVLLLLRVSICREVRLPNSDGTKRDQQPIALSIDLDMMLAFGRRAGKKGSLSGLQRLPQNMNR
jgi:hypothetical protein